MRLIGQRRLLTTEEVNYLSKRVCEGAVQDRLQAKPNSGSQKNFTSFSLVIRQLWLTWTQRHSARSLAETKQHRDWEASEAAAVRVRCRQLCKHTPPGIGRA